MIVCAGAPPPAPRVWVQQPVMFGQEPVTTTCPNCQAQVTL